MKNYPWKVVKLSIKGTSHERTGTPCQDYCLIHRTSICTLLALSDGAGSCALSHIGSKAACIGFAKSVSNYLKKFAGGASEFDNYLMNSSARDWIPFLNDAAQYIKNAAEKRNADPEKSMACTFLGAIVGHTCAVFLQVGDGAWVSQQEDNTFHPLTWPENGEYANETFFITDPDFIDHLQFKKVTNQQKLQSIIGFSDGIEILCLNFTEKLAENRFFSPLLNAFRFQSQSGFQIELINFLQSDRVTSLTDDDKSMIILDRDSNLQ